MAGADEIVEMDIAREIPINHIVPDDLPLLFSDQMVVRHQNGVFVLMFFQNRNPITLTPEAVAAITQIDSRCIAQIAVTPEAMLKNLAALAQNYQKFADNKGEVENKTE